jgi:putative transcriptional regulator
VNPLHHPSEAVLTGYVSGALRPAFAITAAAHIETCAECRAKVRLLEQVGGELLADLPQAEMSAGSLDHAMARLDRPSVPDEPAPRGRIAGRIRFGRKRYVAPGVWVRHARRETAGRDLLYLLRIPGGMTAVPHGHGGQEFTAILKGAYSDAAGTFAAGDFAELDDGADHKPSALNNGECICLIASEKPMRMQTWAGRLVQMLTGT